MPFTSSAHPLPRRNARSFDLDDSATKAAAWVWHLHTSKPGITTEGRFISSQSRRRSSSNFDRKSTRFRQEASTAMTTTALPHGHKTETPVWDCGSTLYDTFELVAFGNRLDRSLMEAVPVTPPQAVPQQHHKKSPLHEPNGILRTLSLPRSLSRQTSKNDTATESMNANRFKQSKSCSSDRKASSTGTVQKASTKWSRVGKLMNVIRRVVVLHKQVSFVGCKRSINVIESSQRPLDSISERKDDICTRGNQLLVNKKVGANLNTSNSRDSESVGDDLSIHYPKVRSNSGIRGSYKLSTPSNSNDECGGLASIPTKITAYNSESLGSALSTNPKLRSNSESTRRDGLSFEHKKIKPRRKFVEDESVYMDDRIKGSYLESVNVKERSRDSYKHMHHHHHHHHHHHYLHHYLASESARLSPETMSKICTEQSWLI